MSDVKALMEGKPLHWTEEAVCHDDRRFTGRLEHLVVSDLYEMDRKCGVCPVFKQCNDWAYREQVTDVFAAGYWRHPDGQLSGEHGL